MEIGIIGLGDMDKLYTREFFKERIPEGMKRSNEIIKRFS